MNLRKDHCRNLCKSRTTRELVITLAGGALRGRSPASPRVRDSSRSPRGRITNPRRGLRQGNLTREHAPGAPDTVCPGTRRLLSLYLKRLSATDISALASMKNVAKCDTWCELQNPVNHRVFERKLRPKPLGRGHVCLGVTHRCPTPPLPGGLAARADNGLPCAPRSRLAQI